MLRTLLFIFLSCSGGGSDPDEDKTPTTSPTNDSAVDDTAGVTTNTEVSDECQEYAAQSLETLNTTCYQCHGLNGSIDGGFNYVLDVERMKATGKIVPFDPDSSRIYMRVENDTMPKAGFEPRPSAEQVAALRSWIECGAPDFIEQEERVFVSNQQMHEMMAEDLNSLSPTDRPFIRYLSLVHLYNAGTSHDQLRTYRNGLSKLINSLTWANDLVIPEPIDENETILRIDLRELMWEATTEKPVSTWETVLKAYPYNVTAHRFESDDYDANFESIQMATQSRFPYMFGDWFVHAVSVPPLYHHALQLPMTTPGFLALFGVDLDMNVAAENVVRAGFDGETSGVSTNNRIIERHVTQGGYCWVSYDFAEEDSDINNIFINPLHFEYDGGELFCTLPNGMQAYFLTDAVGVRIDRGPHEIVQDRDSETGEVINGLSCMRCHYDGIIPKGDQIRAHVQAHESDYSNADLQTIYAMYIDNEEMEEYQLDDQEEFLEVVNDMGIPQGESEPIVALSERWEESLSLALVAAEMGKTADEFRTLLDTLPPELAEFNVLKIEGRNIKRSIYLGNATELLCFLNFGDIDCVEDDECGESGVSCLTDHQCVAYGADEGACYEDSLGAFEGSISGDCNDQIDNDNDGLADCNDSGCMEDPICHPSSIDEDGDGYSSAVDCDDANPWINPGATDTPSDGIDQDCDGEDAIDSNTVDDDGDGYTENEGDCDDTDPAINPDAEEIAFNGTDENCDGLDSNSSLVEDCDNNLDDDVDGLVDCDDPDCSGDSDCNSSSLCSDTCIFDNDGYCDDGGSGSDSSFCALGTDCSDCGPR